MGEVPSLILGFPFKNHVRAEIGLYVNADTHTCRCPAENRGVVATSTLDQLAMVCENHKEWKVTKHQARGRIGSVHATFSVTASGFFSL